MTPTPSPVPATPSAPRPTAPVVSCCRRPMSSIEVTTRGATLVLRSCAACGAHTWERDGVQADRTDLIDGVRTFLEQPRLPTPRRRRRVD